MIRPHDPNMHRYPTEHYELLGSASAVLIESIAQMARDIAPELSRITSGKQRMLEATCDLCEQTASHGLRVVITVCAITRAEYDAAEDAP